MDNFIEVIAKYNGDIFIIKKDIEIFIEILSQNYAILTLKPEDVGRLAFYREIEYIEQPKNLAIMLNTALDNSCITRAKTNPYNLQGEGVLVAIIDSGINYIHKDFRKEDGTTRIKYIWDQTIEGNPPKGFLGGSLYTEEDINNALINENPYTVVPQQDILGHGTAVAGIACGNGNKNKDYTGVASKSSIIAVKLGERGREFFARNTEIMRAIKFVSDKAIELNMPLVINISFGTNDGSHTGTSLFETYIDDMCNIWKTSIIVASGNEGDTAHHYKNIIKTKEKIEIEIEISNNLSLLNIVLFKNFVDIFTINLKSPTGEEIGFLNNTKKTGIFNFSNEEIFLNWTEPKPYTLEQEISFEIVSKNKSIKQGIWKIEIYGENIVYGKFDIWLPVTEAVSKNTKFLNPSVETTLTIPSTASNVISVGGYNDLLNFVAEFSGRGFTSNDFVKPDMVAPSVNITTTSNTLGYDSFSGTSMAAPFVTGACAILMEWGIIQKNDLFLYGERMKAFLRIGAKRKNDLVYPNKEWGYGSLCLLNSLNILEQYKDKKIVATEKLEVKEILLDEKVEYSEDYETLVAQYDESTEDIIQKYDFIKSCEPLTGGFAVLYIKRKEFKNIEEEDILKMSLQSAFHLGLMNTSALDATGILAVQNQPFLNLKGNGVLVGIIDTGINYTIDEFIYDDNTTKIISIWDQTIDGVAPKTKCFGAEYSREQINEALSSEEPYNIVPSKDTIGHGTKIASICAAFKSKNKDFIGAAPDSELLIVKLKEINKKSKKELFINEDVPAYNGADLMLGIEYLYEKAKELNKPLAIYIGLGTNEGAHNGLSILEEYISIMSKKNGVGISICNGNESNAQHHTFLKLDKVEEEKTIELKVGENEKGFSMSIVVYPADKIGINIISPIGEKTGRIPPRKGYNQEIFLALSNTRIQVQFFDKIFQGSGQVILLTFKSPSNGIWKVNVYGERILIGNIHAWLPISNFLNKDTYFLNPDPFYTVTTPATAESSLFVGGYNSFDGSSFIKSGRGPTRIGSLRPITVAPAVNVSCIGANGNLETLTGTSAATAIATGCCALMLEWGVVKGNDKLMNTVSILGYFINGTESVQNEKLPNNIWGFGKLNILKTFENI